MMDVNGASHQELDARAALDECEDRDLAEMNVRYAVVKIGGKTRVVSLEDNPVFPGCKVPVFSTIPDFCAFHAKYKKRAIGPESALA